MVSGKEKLTKTAQDLKTAASMLEHITGFKNFSRSFRTRARRLENSMFTVALFGAFSAGKSSFANALLGEMVLPVSPNPTTAAINRILPPNQAYPHGSVRVRLKNAEDMANDVAGSLKVLSLADRGLEENLAQIAALTPENVTPQAKPHFSFLKSFHRGYPDLGDQLGRELTVDLAAFKSFVAKEEKACFVEWIELYYDCPLTRQGITLIDTPGSDSINARHTGVAFDYIKNADAVLFITYFNNAFSHADKEFLIQLGRVKTAMEKEMFFIVNAADLAKTPAELDDVVTHVRTNLISCGVTQPRIYPVSSQIALLAKLHGENKLTGSPEKVYRQRLSLDSTDPLPLPETGLEKSGLTRFEGDFLKFIVEDLTAIAVASAQREISRAIHALKEFIEMAEQDETRRTTALAEYQSIRHRTLAVVESFPWLREQQAIAKEIMELIYYVRERIILRYHDNFSFIFFHALGGSQDQKKQVRDETLRFVSAELVNEMRATGLRIEKFIQKTIRTLFDKVTAELTEVHSQLEFPGLGTQTVSALDYYEEMFAFDQIKTSGQAINLNSKDAAREQLKEWLQQPVKDYLARENERLTNHYQQEYQVLVSQIKNELTVTIDEYFTGLTAALTLNTDISLLTKTRHDLMKLISSA